jgi:hypothetical protein
MKEMSDSDGDQRPRERPARRRRLWALAVVLLTCLTVATVIALTRSDSSHRQSASTCIGAVAVPEVARVSADEVGGLREDVSRALPQRVGRLYEEGTVRATVAWSDEEPAPPAISPSARRPAGYEMRWWAPNGDDVVADVLVFSSQDRARRYLALASSVRCHDHAARGLPVHPPLARNLSWLNPDGALQADVFFARGTRVYRLTDAPAGSSPEDVRNSGGLNHAFATIDVLACLLPSAHCVPAPAEVPA